MKCSKPSTSCVANTEATVVTPLLLSCHPQLYELDGYELTELEMMQVYTDAINNFTAINSDRFYGSRFIYAPSKPG